VVNLAISGVNSDNSLAGGRNFAFGGARARNDGAGVPDLAAQVAQFSASVGGVANPNALYLINVGGNDVFDILAGGSAPTIISAAAAAISTSVATLHSMGAQNIIFVGVGDVGSPPSANGAEIPGRNASIALNSAIQAALPSNVIFFNTIGFFDVVTRQSHPVRPAGRFAHGSELPLRAAHRRRVRRPAMPIPSSTNTHPTTQVLRCSGNALVATVPEPGTGLLVAFGVAAIAARRRAERRAA
jgi:phospholipase/lecithinase/hemolysin